MILADYQSYINCQEQVTQAYHNQEYWTRMSILNTARMGISSDRTIIEYATEIWHVQPQKIDLEEYQQEATALTSLDVQESITI